MINDVLSKIDGIILMLREGEYNGARTSMRQLKEMLEESPPHGQPQKILQIVPAPPGLEAVYNAPKGGTERYIVPVFALVEGCFNDGSTYHAVRAMRMADGFDDLEYVKREGNSDYRGMELNGKNIKIGSEDYA